MLSDRGNVESKKLNMVGVLHVCICLYRRLERLLSWHEKRGKRVKLYQQVAVRSFK